MTDRMCIVACGGGTGGHVIPALSIINRIRELRPGVDILYIGAGKSLEERLAKEAGYPFVSVWISPLRRGLVLSNLLLPLKCAVALCQAVYYLIRHRVRLVVGTGGFSAWPACSAARITGKPYVLWEPNALPGLVTRLSAGGASRIYVNYKDIVQKMRLKPEKYLVTGNPVGRNIGRLDKVEARKAFGLSPGNPTIFVTGGSGGAQSINSAVDQVRDELVARGFNLIWQTGKHWGGGIEVQPENRERIVIHRFLDREGMSLAYSAADLAITRCGAMTLAELAEAGLPAILVPFPSAAGGHQEANARAVTAAGGAVMILDRELDAGRLLETIGEISNEETLAGKAVGMKRLRRSNALDRIAGDILSLLE